MPNSSRDAPFLKNALLGALTVGDRERLAPHLKLVSHSRRDLQYDARGMIDYVYFPIGAVMSAVTLMSNGDEIEVATVGKEGMIGHTAAYGQRVSVNRVFVQISGDSWRMEARAFQNGVSESSPLRDLINRYSSAFMAQVSQSVACNGLHQLEKRCCRWLLMTRDRVDSDEMRLTHEFLSVMLGVRRASVTEVLAPLQSEGLVQSRRGVITLLDRKGLEARSCECYQIVKDEYKWLLGPHSVP
jgi:CRP-like cAMP-binding protein